MLCVDVHSKRQNPESYFLVVRYSHASQMHYEHLANINRHIDIIR